jgi:hypothetical protein
MSNQINHLLSLVVATELISAYLQLPPEHVYHTFNNLYNCFKFVQNLVLLHQIDETAAIASFETAAIASFVYISDPLNTLKTATPSTGPPSCPPRTWPGSTGTPTRFRFLTFSFKSRHDRSTNIADFSDFSDNLKTAEPFWRQNL